MDDRLRHAVRRALDDGQPFARFRYALMMGAVDREAFSIQRMENASFLREGGMDLIPSDVCMAAGGGKILDDAAPKTDIDELHALADAENGPSLFQKAFQKKKLEPVQNGINGARALIFRMKKSRINVSAAGQDKTAEGFGRIGRQTGGGKSAAFGKRFSQAVFVLFIGKRPADGAESGKGVPVILCQGCPPCDQETYGMHAGSSPAKYGSGYFSEYAGKTFRFPDFRYPNHKKYGILGSQSGDVGKSAGTGKYREKEVGLQRE